MHTEPDGHMLPHAPQLKVSVCRLEQGLVGQTVEIAVLHDATSHTIASEGAVAWHCAHPAPQGRQALPLVDNANSGSHTSQMVADRSDTVAQSFTAAGAHDPASVVLGNKRVLGADRCSADVRWGVFQLRHQNSHVLMSFYFSHAFTSAFIALLAPLPAFYFFHNHQQTQTHSSHEARFPLHRPSGLRRHRRVCGGRGK